MDQLTSKQRKLIASIYDTYKNKMSFDEFLIQSCNKTSVSLSSTDISKMISYHNLNDLRPATDNQLQFVQEVLHYILSKGYQETVDFKMIKTRGDVAQLLKYYENNYDIYIPYSINYKQISYQIIEQYRDYMIGFQSHSNRDYAIKVLVFYNVLMLDIDNTDLESLMIKLQQFPYTFWIYQTNNGYHVYIVNKTFNPMAFSTLQLMYNLGCDPAYIAFTKLSGFVVRISKKPNREEPFIERFVQQVNDFPTSESIVRLLSIKDSLVKIEEKNM